MKLLALTGQRFGRLLVQERAANVGKNTMWLCRCDCGSEKAVAGKHLTAGKTTSCGCLSAELKKLRQTKHGDTPWNGPHAAEYRIWRHIKSRCLNPKTPRYSQYGGAGITVCQEWIDDYSAFLHDMGRRPSPHHSIDRIDNTKGYEPGNCRWATPVQQSRNRRNLKLTLEIAEHIRAAVSLGIPRKELRARYGLSKSGMAMVIQGRIWRSDHV